MRPRSRQPWSGRLDLWHKVEQMIGRGDLAVCGDDLIWFQDRADATTPDMAQLLAEWRPELIRLAQKAAASKARAARGGE